MILINTLPVFGVFGRLEIVLSWRAMAAPSFEVAKGPLHAVKFVMMLFLLQMLLPGDVLYAGASLVL